MTLRRPHNGRQWGSIAPCVGPSVIAALCPPDASTGAACARRGRGRRFPYEAYPANTGRRHRLPQAESGASGPPQKEKGIEGWTRASAPSSLFTRRRRRPLARRDRAEQPRDVCARPPLSCPLFAVLACRVFAMSFPYHQYVDYSNPATPRVYAWEVTSSTSASEHDPSLQMPPQDVQQPQQQQVQNISPSQLQLQQLPPPRQTSPQELQHQHQQHQQQQIPYATQLQPQPQPQHQHPQTIHVPPTAPAGQATYRFETITEEDFVHPSAPRRRGASRPPLHVDTSRAASSSSGAAAGSPSALSAGVGASTGTGTGPLRLPHARGHAQSAHPYRRPHSRAAGGSGVGAGSSSAPSGSGSGQQGGVRASRRVSEPHMTRETRTPPGSATLVGGIVPPAVGTAQAVSCPAQDSWREGLLGLSRTGQLRTSSAGAGAR